MTTLSQKKATQKYDAKNTIQFKMKLNKNTDADILAILDVQKNKQGFIKELIRNSETYYVVENKNIGLHGKPEFSENVIWTGTFKEATEYAEYKRTTYRNKEMVDCFVVGEIEYQKRKANANKFDEIWQSLTKEEKENYIEVDGKKYVKKIYEALNK